MRIYRRYTEPILEADDIDDFDLVDDLDDYDDFDDLDDDIDDEIDDELTERQQLQLVVLEEVADNLDVDFTIEDDNLFSFNISSKVSVTVDVFENPVKFVLNIDDAEEVDCTSTTSDISELCDNLTLAIMVIKEAKQKLRGA